MAHPVHAYLKYRMLVVSAIYPFFPVTGKSRFREARKRAVFTVISRNRRLFPKIDWLVFQGFLEYGKCDMPFSRELWVFLGRLFADSPPLAWFSRK